MSQAIKSLEAMLSTKLFDRGDQALRLTPAGEEFVREATEILTLAEGLERNMRSFSNDQVLSVGISPFYGRYYLPRSLPLFKKKHPNITLSITECSSNELEVLLSEKKLDIAFLPLPLRDMTLEYIPVLEEEIFFAIPRNQTAEYEQKKRGATAISQVCTCGNSQGYRLSTSRTASASPSSETRFARRRASHRISSIPARTGKRLMP